MREKKNHLHVDSEERSTDPLSCGGVCHFEKWHYRITMKL